MNMRILIHTHTYTYYVHVYMHTHTHICISLQPVTIPSGLMSTNDPSRLSITPDNKLISLMYGKAFGGMPLRSRCYNYEVCMRMCMYKYVFVYV